MAKPKKSNKEHKKKPQMTLREKRAAKENKHEYKSLTQFPQQKYVFFGVHFLLQNSPQKKFKKEAHVLFLALF